MFAVSMFAGLILLTFISRLQLWPIGSDPRIKATLTKMAEKSPKLFVYVHGLDRGRFWPSMREVLKPCGDTLKISYSSLSNAKPLEVAQGIANEIKKNVEQGEYKHVVLVGQSMGALLTKRAFLDSEKKALKKMKEGDEAWTSKVSRIVLVAGMNRGWDISGQKPSDMSFSRWFQIWFGTWFARVSGIGGLALSSETGTPFVANLRMDWIKRMADPKSRGIEVVQLLGDIDNLVSAEDNKDLRLIGNGQFAWIKVRGTGHGNIVDFSEQTTVGNLKLGEYRRKKFELAATEPNFDELARANEVLPFQPDPDVTHVVFVVHGIRDLGEWAAAFEQELQEQFQASLPAGCNDKLAVASVRYGYFGMGPFLLRPVREKYVKWLMDEYTETLAQFPKANHVHFVGHSNGTYLLAAALEHYRSLNIRRVVFGGSVVRQDYDWKKVLGSRDEQIESVAATQPQSEALRVINYTAVDDWVVALFPRFFEPAPMMTLLNNDIGSAGFNGFSASTSQVINVVGLSGGHAAFLSRIPQISAFILKGEGDAGLNVSEIPAKVWYHDLARVLSAWGSRWGNWFVIWPFLVLIVVMVGWHVVTAASEPRWPFFLAYVALLLMILRKV